MRTVWLNLIFAPLLFTACEKPSPLTAANPIQVSVQKAEARVTPVTYEFTAQTESSRLVEIRTRVSGFLDRRTYKEGEIVREGQVLFQIDRKPFEAQLAAARGELAARQAALSVAQATLARVRPLAELNALSKKDLDDAAGQEKSAQAAVEVAKANVQTAELNLSYATIKSPLRGLSGSAKIQDGSYLNASSQDSLLTTVAALDPMRVNFAISENEYLQHRDRIASGVVAPPEGGRFAVEIVLADGSTFPVKGTITFADPSFGQSTGTMQIRAEIPNPDGILKPGQFVRARLKGASYPKGIQVPQAAVQQGAQGYFVWTVDGENKAQPRPVKVGQWIGDRWLILEGLSGGEQVVTDGFLRLAPGAPVKVTAPASAPAAPPAAAK